MAEDQPKVEESAENSPPEEEEGLSWTAVWHQPTLLLGFVLLVAGTWLAMPEPETNDFSGVLDRAEQLLAINEFARAGIELDKVANNLLEATKAERARHWMLRADLIYLQQRHQQGDVKENHLNILQYYRDAEKDGQVLDADRLECYAQTLVALDRVDAALSILDRLKQQPPNRRCRFIKQIIERRQARAGGRSEELMRLLGRFDEELRNETNMKLRRPEAIWAASLRAEALADSGHPKQSIDFLTKRIQRFIMDGRDDDIPQLYLLLAKAYQQTGEAEDARRYFLKTQQLIDRANPLNADVLVGIGQLDLTDSDKVNAALEHFRRVVIDFPNSRAFVHALLGQGDCEAKLGLHGQAIEHLGQAVNALAGRKNRRDPRRQELARIAESHYSLNFDKDDFERALDYLILLKLLHEDELPTELLIRLAVTHERLAQRCLAEAQIESATADSVPSLSPDQQGGAFQAAALDYKSAGEYYFQHSNAVTIEDDAAHGLSLWKSAECFDKAQLWQQSINVYSQFVKTRESDTRFLSANRRLGRAFQADGQYNAAADKFKQLIEHHRQSQVAFESLVPLAHCQIALGENDRAKHVLKSVVENHVSIRPNSREYRTALIELAKLHYQLEEYSDAISRFTAAVDRYGNSSDGPSLVFYLADALRRSVRKMDEKLEEVLPQSVEQRFRQDRRDRLAKAQGLYGQVIVRLEGREEPGLTGAEELFLRNSYFYQADCVYQLRHWGEAISLYDTASKRWEKHPASLVALVQIVNAYAEQGKISQAKVANDRARYQLRQIPDEAFGDESLPMTREHWQDWLRWASELDLYDPQANAAAGSEAGAP